MSLYLGAIGTTAVHFSVHRSVDDHSRLLSDTIVLFSHLRNQVDQIGSLSVAEGLGTFPLSPPPIGTELNTTSVWSRYHSVPCGGTGRRNAFRNVL